VTVRFLDIAEIELDEAIDWYKEQAPGLGDAFLIAPSPAGGGLGGGRPHEE